jgi:hypothetical protein
MDATDALNKRITELEAEIEEVRAAAGRVTALATRDVSKFKERAEKAEADLAALQRFKTYVHERLDQAGVPEKPEPANHALHGCRVGDRLDFLLGQRDFNERRWQEVARLHADERTRRQALEYRDLRLTEEYVKLEKLIESLDQAMAAPERIASDTAAVGGFLSSLHLTETAEGIVARVIERLKSASSVSEN